MGYNYMVEDSKEAMKIIESNDCTAMPVEGGYMVLGAGRMSKNLRLTVIVYNNKNARIVNVKIWPDIDHLNKSILQQCYNILYKEAITFESNVVCGALHVIDTDYLRYSWIADIQAITSYITWPDRINSTRFYLNNKYIRTMGGKRV